MISKKMRSHLEAEGTIRKMFEKGIELKTRCGAENVFDFSLGNPNVPAPEKVKSSIEKILDTMPPARIHSYMPNAGFTEVRVEVAKHLNRVFGTSYSDKNIIMTAGAGSALNLLFKSMLDVGDEVIVPTPYFPEYKGYIENYYGKVIEVPPHNGNASDPDIAGIARAVTNKTKAVIIDSPNNPTGAVYTEAVIKNLSDALRSKETEIGHTIYLISDEPYRDVLFSNKDIWDLPEGETQRRALDSEELEEGDCERAALPWIPNYYDDTVVAYSYSKSLSLPGERIGNIIVPDSAEGSEELINAITTANLVTGVVNAPSLMQLTIARCLDERVNVDFYKNNMEKLYDIVMEAGFKAERPKGGFYLWVKAPNGDDRSFAQKATEENILVVPGSAFAGPGHVRLSFCVATGIIERSREAWLRLSKKFN